MTQSTFISDIININNFKNNEFNIIVSGCGTGKSHFVTNKLLKEFTDIKSSEIIFVTSRSIIVDQQIINDNIKKYNHNSENEVKYWNGEIEEDDELLLDFGIKIMTYDKLIKILVSKNNEDYETLSKLKILVFDECHVLFSDKFITDIETIKIWIRDEIYKKNKIFLGLTATPNILKFYQKEWGVKINQVNIKPLVNYKVKQLHCTNFNTIPYIVSTNRLIGKTIIMCCSIAECFALQEKLLNAAVLVSKNSKYYTKDMDLIRNKIIKNETLPEKFLYPTKRDAKNKPIEFEERNLDVLITTSTLREGINLNENSGIKNVICCFSDELHIVQFVGRCRFNIDNLVIADTYIRVNNYDKGSYLSKSRQMFKDYMVSKHNAKWFDSIAHIIEHDCYNSKKFILGTDEEKFISYINGKWLVPIGEENLSKYKIYKECDKNEIIDKAVDCDMFLLSRKFITFNKVISLLSNTFGYEVGSGRIKENKQRYTYKIILSLDDDKKTYVPTIQNVDE